MSTHRSITHDRADNNSSAVTVHAPLPARKGRLVSNHPGIVGMIHHSAQDHSQTPRRSERGRHDLHRVRFYDETPLAFTDLNQFLGGISNFHGLVDSSLLPRVAVPK